MYYTIILNWIILRSSEIFKQRIRYLLFSMKINLTTTKTEVKAPAMERAHPMDTYLIYTSLRYSGCLCLFGEDFCSWTQHYERWRRCLVLLEGEFHVRWKKKKTCAMHVKSRPGEKYRFTLRMLSFLPALLCLHRQMSKRSATSVHT